MTKNKNYFKITTLTSVVNKTMSTEHQDNNKQVYNELHPLSPPSPTSRPLFFYVTDVFFQNQLTEDNEKAKLTLSLPCWKTTNKSAKFEIIKASSPFHISM